MPYTPQSWADNDPSKPVSAAREAFQETQYSAAMSDAAALYGQDVRPWAPNTQYAAGQPVVNPSGDVVEAINAFTSGSSYNATNWRASGTFEPAGLSAATKATLVPKWQPNTAYAAGFQVVAPTGDVVSAATTHTSGASYSGLTSAGGNWIRSGSFLRGIDVSDQLVPGVGTALANQVANINAINNAITSAFNAGGGIVAISTPGAYEITPNDSIRMKSNISLYIGPGVTLRRGNNTGTQQLCMIVNANPTGVAPFTDKNMRLYGGGTIDGNTGNGNTSAPRLTSPAPASLTFNYGICGETSWVGVQDLVIEGINFYNGHGSAMQIIGSHISIRNITGQWPGDFIHVNGGTDNLVIENVRASVDDDFIALNAWDWHHTGPQVGDITGVTIRDCTYLGTSGMYGSTNASATIKFLPGTRTTGAGQGAGNIRNVTAENIRNTASCNGIDFLGDIDAYDGNEPSGAGAVENVNILGGYLYSGATLPGFRIFTNATADGQTSLTLRGITVQGVFFDNNLTGAGTAVDVNYKYTTLALKALTFRDCTWKPNATGGQFLSLQSKSAIDSVTIDGLTIVQTVAGFSGAAQVGSSTLATTVNALRLKRIATASGVTIDGPTVNLYGTLNYLYGRDWDMVAAGGTGDNHGINFANASAVLGSAILEALNLTNFKELFSVRNGATGSVICNATVNDTNLINCTHPVFVTGGRQAVVKFRGGNIDTPGNLARVDTSTLTLTLDGTTSSGVAATVITQVNATTLRVPKCDVIALPLNTLTMSPQDGDYVRSSATPTLVVAGTGAGIYISRSTTGFVKLN